MVESDAVTEMWQADGGICGCRCERVGARSWCRFWEREAHSVEWLGRRVASTSYEGQLRCGDGDVSVAVHFDRAFGEDGSAVVIADLTDKREPEARCGKP